MSVDDDFEEMRKPITRMLKDAFEGKLGVFREPFVYGFTMRNREARGDGTFQAVEGQEIRSRDPLVDVALTPAAMFITAEMPGAGDGEGNVRAEGRRRVIEGEGERRDYTAVGLPRGRGR